MDRTRPLAWLLVAGALVAQACGGTDDATRPDDEPGEAAGWPEELVAGAGTGPAIYLDENEDSPAIGYISQGVVVRIMGPPEGDRIPIRIHGPMKIRGWLSTSRLAARVHKRGRVTGTPAYVGENDFVRVLGRADGDLMRVEVRPLLGDQAGTMLGPFVGTFPADNLGSAEVEAGDTLSEGEPHTLPAGEEVQVYSRPNEVVATLPASDPPLTVVVLRDRGRWKGVRIGVGPYLIGYVNVSLTATDQPPRPPDGPPAAPEGSVPERLQVEQERPLWRLPSGTRVRFNGRTMAILAEDGFAREMNRYADTGEADVFVAVDEDIAIRGMVPIRALEEYDGPAPAPTGGDAPEPSEADPEDEGGASSPGDEGSPSG
jgi:hypothetical protein